ncbi:MAG: DegV family EDD domain-containing protein [Candidatus Cloacimonetes bacterium]|nr:DegV family EDD domain-containing protein [Candidatus Cloacimonadota bacterium]
MKKSGKKGMKILYITSPILFTAFMAGAKAIIEQKDHLNKINVYPVADADTGTNLASTMRFIMENSKLYNSLKDTMHSIADSALSGARGNSGIIFAQFIHGIREEMANRDKISMKHFVETISKSVKYVYDSVLEPTEGTIITVIEDWSKANEEHHHNVEDFTELMLKSFSRAKQSLKDTPKKLKVLAQNNVVDAGAQGFVNFLEGILTQLKKGKLFLKPDKNTFKIPEEKFDHSITASGDIKYRYCTEAIISDAKREIQYFRTLLQKYGDSVIVAGSSRKTHLHLHTNSPGELFQQIKDVGTIEYTKVDDMKRQYQVSHNRKYKIALVTDSASDLPREMIEKYQIQVIPFKIVFGKDVFIDKLTLQPLQFYKMLKNQKLIPKSSQPDVQSIKNFYDHLTTYYDKIIAIHISSKLTGVYDSTQYVVADYKDKQIAVIDSKHLSASEGLITARIARAIDRGDEFASIVKKAREWVKKTEILTDIYTLEYLVKGGRISPLKGFMAKLMNLKPIVSVDEEGKGIAFGKSFSRRGNMKKIIKSVTTAARKNKFWNYAIVHSSNLSRAKKYAVKLENELGFPPLYIVDISPVIGVHNGLGTVAVTYMTE